MSRQERTGWRDEAFSRWHRGLDDSFAAVDGDMVEFCVRCRMPLALFELCADIRRTDKCYTVTRNLALMAGLPAWCVLYRAAGDQQTILQVRVKRIAPRDEGVWIQGAPSRLEQLIRRLHSGCPRCGHDSGSGADTSGKVSADLRFAHGRDRERRGKRYRDPIESSQLRRKGRANHDA